MSDDAYNGARALRVYYQTELEGAIKQMKIEGASLEQTVVELNVLADWLRTTAEELPAAWDTLLTGTVEQQRTQDELLAKFGYPPRVEQSKVGESIGTNYEYLRGESDAT